MQRLTNEIEYANTQAQRFSSIASIFREVKQILDSSLKQARFTSESEIVPYHDKGPVAPGIIGSQTDRFMDVFNFTDLLIYSLKKYSRVIESGIIETIDEMNNSQDKLIKEQISLIRSTKLKRKEFFHQYLLNQQEIKDLYDTITRQHLSDEAQDSLKTEFSKYFEMVRNQKKANIEINSINSQYIESIKSAITKIKVFLIQKETCLKSLLLIVHPFLSNLIQPMENFTKRASDMSSVWETEFSLFLRVHKVARTSIPKKRFAPFRFSFQDPLLSPPAFTTRIIETNLPLFIGLVKHDFDAKKENELSVKKGERIYLYEKPNDSWVLASKAISSEFKFVPSKAVEIPEMEHVFTVKPQIAKEDCEMSVGAGELLLVKERREGSEYVLCEGIAGGPKCVHASCLRG